MLSNLYEIPAFFCKCKKTVYLNLQFDLLSEKNAVVEYELEKNEYFEIYDPYKANAQFLLSKRQHLEIRITRKLGKYQ